MNNMMETTVQAVSGTVRKHPESMTIHTTLYNLLAALSAEVGPDEDDVLTAMVVHLLNTYRVTYTGNLQGYRLVCDGIESLARSRQREDGLFSHFDGDTKCPFHKYTASSCDLVSFPRRRGSRRRAMGTGRPPMRA